MNQAIIGLGSNIHPLESIQKAREMLSQRLTVIAESDFITTKPVGYTKQPDFINGAILVKTDQNQEQLRKILKEVERELGRRPQSNKFGPRIIDLDILVWNKLVVDQDIAQRDYLKKSILQLMPELKGQV